MHLSKERTVTASEFYLIREAATASINVPSFQASREPGTFKVLNLSIASDVIVRVFAEGLLPPMHCRYTKLSMRGRTSV